MWRVDSSSLSSHQTFGSNYCQWQEVTTQGSGEATASGPDELLDDWAVDLTLLYIYPRVVAHLYFLNKIVMDLISVPLIHCLELNTFLQALDVPAAVTSTLGVTVMRSQQQQWDDDDDDGDDEGMEEVMHMSSLIFYCSVFQARNSSHEAQRWFPSSYS